MASNQITDAQIYEELHKLGLSDVSETLFQKVKDDLDRVILSEENGSSLDSPRTSSSEKYPIFNSTSLSSSTSRNASRLHQRTPESSIRSNLQLRIARSSTPNKENCLSSETYMRPRIVKRKVLRHVNGESVIEEGVRVVPPIFIKPQWNDDVKPLSSISSSSFEDLSLRIGNLSLSKSSSSKSSVILPNYNVTRRKHDPVTRYHQYRKYWDTFKPPGENKHSSLRWTVREKMLDYDFA